MGAQIRAFCKEKIAYYKIPRYVHFVTSYPMTGSYMCLRCMSMCLSVVDMVTRTCTCSVTGKIQKNILRVEAVKQLKLKSKGHGLAQH